MARVLVQTLLPAHVATWAKRQAIAEGLSVAAWLRRLVIRSKPSPILDVHRDLHEQFDRLLAAFLHANPTARPSSTPIADLMEWSAERAEGRQKR